VTGLVRAAVGDLVVAWHDLVLGGGCTVCSRPGPALCAPCRDGLRAAPFEAWPSPTPPGLVLPVAAAAYDGAVRDLVLAHKERHRLALARPLGGLLAAAVLGLCEVAGVEAEGGRRPVLLVPVPSHPSVVRERRHDPLLRTARCAAGDLRRRGVAARVDQRLRLLRRPGDQAGLDARGRAENVRGTLVARPSGHAPAGTLVLVDDVVTTGATLREAQRALEAADLLVAGAATVAATRRHLRTSP
jgi:predicted amidophosphoribosyltransferase